jgi:hypothetical protein
LEDKQFKDAIIEDWHDDDYLIPKDWFPTVERGQTDEA